MYFLNDKYPEKFPISPFFLQLSMMASLGESLALWSPSAPNLYDLAVELMVRTSVSRPW
jgi:hypothetical protein